MKSGLQMRGAKGKLGGSFGNAAFASGGLLLVAIMEVSASLTALAESIEHKHFLREGGLAAGDGP